MKKLLVLFMLMLTAFAGCNSSTGNDDNDDNGNTGNNTGNGGKYTVSGSAHLNNVDGAGISGATVILASTSQTTMTPLTVTTGSNGAFSFANIAAGSYMVTITKANHTFSPEFVMVTVADKNVIVQTFVGTAVNTSGNAGAHTLFPLKTGATWTYDSVNSISGMSFTEKIIDKVTGTMVQGGKTYWAVVSTTYDSDGEEDDTDTAYLRIENNVLYTYGTDLLTAKTAPVAFKAAQTPAVLKALQSSYGDLAMLKFNVATGTTWDIYKDSGSYQGNTYSIAATGKYIGTETVGAYSNCAKFEVSYASESNSTYGKIAGKWNMTLWLAPNTGPVKTVDTFYTGQTLATVELLSTVTNTLQTSQIP
ncbi:MAG: carboxypeptidase-like regulatory domain-containing protein [Candidatus Latescibacterota bacterium]